MTGCFLYLPIAMNHPRRPVYSRLSLGVLLVLARPPAFAQTDSTDEAGGFRVFWHRKPAVSLLYGFSHTSWNRLSFSVPNPGIGEVRLGGIRDDEIPVDGGITRSRYDFLFASNISHTLGTHLLEGDVSLDRWRAGLGHEGALGYMLGGPGSDQMFLLIHGGGLSWSRLTVKNQGALPSDSAQLALYGDAIRFGMNTEAGLGLRLLPEFQITLAYERDLLFPRHLAGKWLGSVVAEGAGQWVIDRIVRHIMKSAPRAGPLSAFVLKNALSIIFYQLRHRDMFFPFGSGSPLSNDSFSVGIVVAW